MELVQLFYFQHVAATQSLTLSSQELHITQPALSKSISRLEKELGILLFDRDSNRIYLNEAGVQFAGYVDRILTLLDEAVAKTKETAEKEKKRVKVASAVPMFGVNLNAIYQGDLEIITRSTANDEAVSLLKQGKVDFVITTELYEDPQLIYHQIGTEKLYLFLSRTHELSDKEHISLLDLQYDKFCEIGTDIIGQTRKLCAVAGFSPEISFISDDLIPIDKHLATSECPVTFVPAYRCKIALERDSLERIRAHEVTDQDCSLQIYLAERVGTSASAHLEEMEYYTKKVFETMRCGF